MANILLADADRELRETCAAFLSGHGFRAETAETGLQCVAKLRRDVPDLLILDLELPWGGGDGVLGFLREEPQFLPERIVLTSSAGSAPVLRGLATPPAVRALTKPFAPADLLKHTAFDADEPEFSSAGDQRPGVLVVDDEGAIRDLLKLHLQDHGYRVWTAPGGDEALDHCCNHGDEIAVILLDVNMPGLDGPQTLEGIRAFDSELPVCFMSSDAAKHQPADFLALGAQHLFPKPLDLDELVRVVRRLATRCAEEQSPS